MDTLTQEPTDLEMLECIRAAISKREDWYHGLTYQYPENKKARCIGVVWARTADETLRSHRLLGFDFCHDVYAFNDSHTHDEVLAYVDERITLCAEGQI